MGVWLAIVLLVSSVISPLQADVAATRDLRVTDAFNQVTIEPAENPKAPVPIDEDTPLQENDVVVTGPDSKTELTMDGETVFKILPESRFKILKILPANTQFELSQGGMLAKVKPVAREDEAIILKMPTAVVAIRGTEFGAETGDGVSHVGVFDEGHVAVAGAWGHEHVLLEPNQETHVPLSNVPVPPQKLLRFKAQRAQMVQVRARTAYWHQHWEPMGPIQRKSVRQRLTAPVRFHSNGFRHSAMKQAVKKPVKPHHLPAKAHAKKHPAVHQAAKKRTTRQANRVSAKRSTSSGKARAKAHSKTHPRGQ
jgi:hypothetical protein